MGEFVRVERDGRPGTGPGTGLEIERLRFSGLFTTEDQRAVMRSFVENGRGKATFTGR